MTAPRIFYWTIALSFLAHLLLVLALGEQARCSTAEPLVENKSKELVPLRFSGQTFEVEALSPDELSKDPHPNALAAQPTPSSSKTIPQKSKSAPPSPPATISRSKATNKTSSPSKEKPKRPNLPNKPIAKKAATHSSPPAPQKSGGSGAKVGGAYGQEALPAGTVDLYRAFLKTLPLAAKADPAWTQLALGPAGTVDFSLQLDEHFKLRPVTLIENRKNPAPTHLRKMVLLNRNFLLRGRFAIVSRAGGAKSSLTSKPVEGQRLKLSAVVSQKSPDKDTPDAPGVRAFGLRGGTTPTGAYFTYFSGRHVELFLLRR